MHERHVSAYYFASYMNCLFGVEGLEQKWIIDHIESFSNRQSNIHHHMDSLRLRCRVIASFLVIKRQDFEYWDVFIADKWMDYVFSLEMGSL